MQRIIKTSAFIVTRNNANSIGSTLNRLIEFDEVIVVDCGSTDTTIELAQNYPNVETFEVAFFSENALTPLAYSLCRNEWIVIVEAGELLSERSLETLSKASSTNSASITPKSNALQNSVDTLGHQEVTGLQSRVFHNPEGHSEKIPLVQALV